VYSGFLFACTGVVCIANNLVLFVVPVICWAFMTIALKLSEEKWLKALYGDEYVEYCKRVNRCIPWFK
jgi:protein-S-isoprenylcysteine O-methyltransferase Ste14